MGEGRGRQARTDPTRATEGGSGGRLDGTRPGRPERRRGREGRGASPLPRRPGPAPPRRTPPRRAPTAPRAAPPLEPGRLATGKYLYFLGRVLNLGCRPEIRRPGLLPLAPSRPPERAPRPPAAPQISSPT